ncbi:L-lactate MFS transporter [Brevibacterium litoralis]|uniref:L-lactate MFS transporter n=1 Tax=Brevibacterium litoralis TaxID=3138935 RepID=UPI003D9A45B6
MSVLDREAIVAPKDFNRWLMPAAALAIHLCIGQVYALSVFKSPFMEKFAAGEVAIGWIFSLAILMLGLSAAVAGSWVEKAGPRKSMVVAGLFWVVGFFVSTLGIATGQLWLLYVGYGVIGGIGLGIGYISPVSTLMKWFPDKPGLASGLAIMGFGGGALIASPVSNALMAAYGGGSELADLTAGLTPTFMTLAVAYAIAIAAGAYVIRLPHPEWKPAGYDPAGGGTVKDVSHINVSVNQAMKTPQFWMLWIVLFTNVTAGIGILENASPMVQDYFPEITAGAAAGYVGLLSLANMAGRFVWSSASDYIGRKNVYIVYLGVGLLLYLFVALLGGSNLVLFILATLVILSFYGGGFATMPSYLRDYFGVHNVGAIHGRVLTAWAAAGVAGPLIVNTVVESQTHAGKEGAAVYTLGLSIMVGVLAVGFVANILMRPVAKKHYASADEIAEAKAVIAEAASARPANSGPIHRTVAWVLLAAVTIGLAYGLIQTIVKAVQIFA